METALGTLRKNWQHVSARWIAVEVKQRICVRTQDQSNQMSATDRSGGDTVDLTSRGARDESRHGYRHPQQHDWRFQSSSDQC
jgi:hypothetical protein